MARADPARIGIWGHSMGGEVGLRALEADRDRRLKAAVFWAPTSGNVGANSRFYSQGAAPEVAAEIGFQLSPINYVSWVAASRAVRMPSIPGSRASGNSALQVIDPAASTTNSARRTDSFSGSYTP